MASATKKIEKQHDFLTEKVERGDTHMTPKDVCRRRWWGVSVCSGRPIFIFLFKVQS